MSKKDKIASEEIEEVNNEEVLNDNMDNELFDELQSKYEAKCEEAKSNLESLQRIMAEFDNYKKRSNKEREQLYNSLVADIISEFLGVLDNLDMALQNESKDEGFKSGIELIKKQFIEVLAKFNVEEIKALNETFDPNLHESINHVEDSNYGEKEVIEVYRKGYKLGDKVLRYAMVKVAN